jgi:small conductance mechanosensitive channel
MDWKELIPELKKYITDFGVHIIAAIAILIIGFWVAKLITKILNKILIKKEVDPTLTGFLTSSLKFTLYLFIIIAAVSRLGVETTSFIALLGAAGLAIGLALQGSLANVAAGLMLIFFRQVRVGQMIESVGIIGTVEKVGVFNTTLLTMDNKVIYVPNAKLVNDNIINYTEKETRRIDLVFGISYKDDIDKAKAIIISIFEADPRILKNPEPMLVVGELGDSSVNLFVRPWVKTDNFYNVKFSLIESIKKRFDEENITIPFPQRDIYIHQK